MSLQMQAVGLYMRATSKRTFTDPAGGSRMLAMPKRRPDPAPRTMRGLTVRQEEVQGFPVHSVTREGLEDFDLPTLIYVHGGSFCKAIAPQHWQLVAQVARELDVTVQVPLYGLAPDHHAAEARSLLATLVDRVEADRRASYLMGDSAGGNLALVAAQQAVARGVTGLQGATLIAPWLDLTLSNPEVDAMEDDDPWLARAALPEVARSWADGTPLDDPSVSPLFGSFEGLPPVDLWIGERDICLPDCQLLRDALAEVGTVYYHQGPGALHVFPLLPAPEGKRARTELIAHVRRALAA
ncbi:alpha/beta hydrolase fold domain-containing protein [Nocardioides sambongensis]|uniref:alpha/beta hydrolase fold domain-containing protein n=1 Tax=Nocardioides sambongensis TaxID=2589074 RepID=UPI00112A5223|nr:alpha/beta hydrolase [Nocardioides sambongensis]